MPNLRKRHIRQNPGFRTAAAVAALCSVAMLSGGCANDPIAGNSTAPTTRYDFPRLGLSAAALTRAQTCDDVVAYFKAAAKEMVSAQQGYGYGGDVFATADAAGSAADGAAPATVPAARESNRTATPESSTAGSSDDKASFDETATGTNNQEAGVDEADMIKTDGRRVVSIRGQELIVVDLDGGAAAVSGRVTLPDGFSAASLFLTGDRVMVLGSSWLQTEDSPAGASGGVRDDAALDMGWSPGASAVQVVEVALGGQPTVVATRSVEGWLTDARMSDGTVRVIVSNSKQPYY
ncbi:MAG: beta-propeller domain-containing protein, partial [Microthrixaceae bacterium]|nr:beta-propeller domain-containing protein [Microthrixaceae bacterium]